MRILLVTDSMDLGGAETHILTLARALQAEGEQVEVCSGGGRLTAVLTASGIPHRTVCFGARTPIGALRAYLALRRLLSGNAYDVVHAHARYPAFLCRLLQRHCVRFVTTCHAAYPDGICSHLPWHGQHVFTVSEDLRERLLRWRTLPPQGVSVVRNAIFPAKEVRSRGEAEQACGLAPSAHRILAVHRMDRDTALPARMLLNLLPRLRKRFADAQVVLVGDGDALCELQALATSGAVLAGGVTDPTPYLSAADVLVGVSRSALEAMAQGVPVILAGREGFGGLVTESCIPDMQANNFTGRGMQNLDENLLEQAILSFFSQEEGERKAQGERGKALIKKQYDPKQLAEATVQIYRWIQPRNAPREALLVGYLGCENLGDDGMLLAERTQITGGVCLARNPRRAARTYGMPCYGRYNLPAIISCLVHTKKLVLGGGSLLQNKTSNRSLLYYSALFRLAGICGARRVILANGLGPLNGRWARRIAAGMLTEADRVTLRDPVSLALARTLGVGREIKLCADPALLTVPAQTAPVLPQACTLVCLRRGATQRTQETVCAYTEPPPAFLAMQPCDRALAAALARRTGGILLPPMTIGQLVTLLQSGKVRAVVTARYHLALLAASAELPCLAIGEDPKLLGLSVMGLIPRPVSETALRGADLARISCGSAVPFASSLLLGEAMK